METCQVVEYEEYIRLLWWATIGYRKILEGKEDPKEIAKKHLDGIEKMVENVHEYETKIEKKTEKVSGKLEIQ